VDSCGTAAEVDKQTWARRSRKGVILNMVKYSGAPHKYKLLERMGEK
jgi:hypothetical protein